MPYMILDQNEFLASKYSESVGGDATLGTATLSAFEIPTDPAWLWGGVAFGAGFFLLTNMASGAAMEYIRITRDIGTARQSTDECSSEANEEPVVGVSTLATESAQAIASTLASLPFVPMSIAWRDIRYSVTLPAAAAKVDALDPREKVLLHAVTGYAGPGQLLALMGASGAGVGRHCYVLRSCYLCIGGVPDLVLMPVVKSLRLSRIHSLTLPCAGNLESQARQLFWTC